MPPSIHSRRSKLRLRYRDAHHRSTCRPSSLPKVRQHSASPMPYRSPSPALNARTRVRAHSAAYNNLHSGQIRAHSAAYNSHHNGQIRAHSAAYNNLHSGQIRAHSAAYNSHHNGQIRAHSAAYNNLHNGQIRAHSVAYNNHHNGQIRAFSMACLSEVMPIRGAMPNHARRRRHRFHNPRFHRARRRLAFHPSLMPTHKAIRTTRFLKSAARSPTTSITLSTAFLATPDQNPKRLILQARPSPSRSRLGCVDRKQRQVRQLTSHRVNRREPPLLHLRQLSKQPP